MTLTEMQTWLDGLAKIASELPDDLPGLEARVGAIVAADVGQSFAQSRSPEGAAWQPLKRRLDMPLIDTGALLAAALEMGSRTSVDAVRGGVRVDLETGGLPEYGLFQDRGTRNIPARPFVGVSAQAAEQIADAAAELWGLEFTRRVMAFVDGVQQVR